MANGFDIHLIEHQMTQIKSVLVGDEAIGKTGCVVTYFTNPFREEHVPTILDSYSTDVVVEDQKITLKVWDTGGSEDYTQLRLDGYTQTDVFVICFSLIAPTSLENAKNVWVPEVKKHCPTTPYILVGLKSDLRDQFAENAAEFSAKGWEPIPASKAEEIKQEIGARAYVECSAKLQSNLKEVFDAAIKVVLHPVKAD
jgi:small GTP-binding protein